MPKDFQSVVDANYENLYRFAISLCKSQSDAWDLTQETFLIWAKKGNTIRTLAATKSWLYTTLYREFLKTAKRSQRQTSLDDQEFVYEEETATADEIAKLDSHTAMELLAGLKIEYRQVVAGLEIELLETAGAALQFGREIGGDMGLAVRADRPAVGIEHHEAVVPLVAAVDPAQQQVGAEVHHEGPHPVDLLDGLDL